eukprot:g78817.t1
MTERRSKRARTVPARYPDDASDATRRHEFECSHFNRIRAINSERRYQDPEAENNFRPWRVHFRGGTWFEAGREVCRTPFEDTRPTRFQIAQGCLDENGLRAC